MKKSIGLAVGIMAAVIGAMSGCSKTSEITASPADTTAGSTAAVSNEAKTEAAKSDYPKSKIELIIPQGVGGGSDLIARVLASQVEKDLGVPVVCTNVEGGSTSLGLQQLADSEPDGYTIAMTMTNLATLKSLGYSELTYEDFTSVCGANFDAPTVMIRSNDERFTAALTSKFIFNEIVPDSSCLFKSALLFVSIKAHTSPWDFPLLFCFIAGSGPTSFRSALLSKSYLEFFFYFLRIFF